jgi:hypothetical protein
VHDTDNAEHAAHLARRTALDTLSQVNTKVPIGVSIAHLRLLRQRAELIEWRPLPENGTGATDGKQEKAAPENRGGDKKRRLNLTPVILLSR